MRIEILDDITSLGWLTTALARIAEPAATPPADKATARVQLEQLRDIAKAALATLPKEPAQ